MSEPFLSEIKLVSFNFAPKGWALCNGQLLPINQNQGLFALLGTRYGGNGQTNFALPNLQGRVPIHMGNGHNLGEAAGSESVTLNISQMPAHTHFVNASNDPTTTVAPNGNFLGPFNNGYVAPANFVALRPETVSNVGGSQPHTNMQPYTVLTYCIALQGIFPSQN